MLTIIIENEKSLDHYRNAIKRFERLQDNRWVSYGHAQIATVYIETKNLDRAEQHALKGYQIATTFDLKKEKGDNLLVLSKVYTAMGDQDKAAKYKGMYDDLMDSLIVELDPRGVPEQAENEGVSSSSHTAWYDGFLNALIISALIGVFVLGMGLSFKNR